MPGIYYHTWAGHLRTVTLLWQRYPIEFTAAKPPRVPLIHFSIASNYGNGLPLPNNTPLYLLSQTSTLKNSKSHNPTAQSGFISISWLHLFDYCVIMSQLPWCSPSFVLLKSSFVDLSSAVFLCFSVRISHLTWRWVDFYTSMAFPTTPPFYVCPYRLQQQYATQSASSQAK